MKKMIKGFTLAEVLITMAIIGVIVAISVPSLIQKTNKANINVKNSQQVNKIEYSRKIGE